ncbi:MAG: glutathione S-transferase [Zoogloeaceae bacterium]|nr:glutathione S-transferase [Zoogloeaceae bacterium]
MPLLYSFRRCPYAIRARLALIQAGVEFDLQEVALRNKPQAMLALSPKGTVPVLLLADGRILDESLDIMRWALSQNDPQGWLTKGDAKAQAELIERNDALFKPLLDRYKYPTRFPEQPANEARDTAIRLHLAPLDQQLATQGYLFGDSLSLADAALLPFVRQFAAVDANWFESIRLLALRRWLHDGLASPLFKTAMRKPE